MAATGATAMAVAMMIGAPPTAQATPHRPGPCDIYAAARTPCVAAYSPARVLKSNYTGPLYRVTRQSDGATRNISALPGSDYADAGAQDRFCARTGCTISLIYDQSGNRNDLSPAGSGDQGAANGPADAAALPITIAGHRAYGIHMPPEVAYRRASTDAVGTARGQQPESMYEVASGTNVNSACCTDFGNVETRSEDTGAGHMDTINLSTKHAVGATGHGPWVEADLENGVFQGKTNTWTANRGNSSKFVTATLRNNGVDTFSLQGGDGQHGPLTTWYSGSLPDGTDADGNAWKPMHLEGSIGLGAGGDNSNRGTQSFFEGVMTSGYARDAAQQAVQANIVAQRYSAVSTGGGPGRTITDTAGRCLDVAGDDVGGNGAPVQFVGCRGLAADQHWIASGYGYGDGTLATLGHCLSAARTPGIAHRRAVLAGCDGSASQRWTVRADGSLRSTASRLCLAPTRTAGTRAPAELSRCQETRRQQLAATTPILHPVDGQAAACVDVEGDDVDADGRQVQLGECQDAVAGAPGGRAEALDQQWTYDHTTRTLTTLRRCLTADAARPGHPATASLERCDGSPSQAWLPRANRTVQNRGTRLCLQATAGQSGTPLVTASCDAAQAQRFELN